MFTASIDNPVRKFRQKRIWSEEGMVIIVDDRTGEISFDTPDIAEKKSEHAIHQANNMRRGEFGNYQDERREMTQLATDLKEVAAYARLQESPLDVAETCVRICRREKQARQAKPKPLLFVPPGI